MWPIYFFRDVWIRTHTIKKLRSINLLLSNMFCIERKIIHIGAEKHYASAVFFNTLYVISEWRLERIFTAIENRISGRHFIERKMRPIFTDTEDSCRNKQLPIALYSIITVLLCPCLKMNSLPSWAGSTLLALPMSRSATICLTDTIWWHLFRLLHLQSAAQKKQLVETNMMVSLNEMHRLWIPGYFAWQSVVMVFLTIYFYDNSRIKRK